MDASTFLLTVLGFYALYYAGLFAYDRFRLGSQGGSTSSSQQVYHLDKGNGSHTSSHSVQVQRHGEQGGFSKTSLLSATEDDDSDLGIEYISDDGIEAIDEKLDSHFRTVISI